LTTFIEKCPFKAKLIPIDIRHVQAEKVLPILSEIISQLKLGNEYLVAFYHIHNSIIEIHHKTKKTKTLFNLLSLYFDGHFIWNGSNNTNIIITTDKTPMQKFIAEGKLYKIYFELKKKLKIVDIQHILNVVKFETYFVNYNGNDITIEVFDLHRETAKFLLKSMSDKIGQDLTVIKSGIM
jgi:hypothetical protein